jgi:hypothetical protein
MADSPKMRWADIADEEDLKSLEIPVVISKHGIKISKKPSYVPPNQRPVKKQKPLQGKEDGT